MESVSKSFRANWLLVSDGVDDLKLQRAKYWPAFGTGAVLVTSRDPMAKSQFLFENAGIDMKPFSDDDGGALPLQWTECESQDYAQAAHNIARKLGALCSSRVINSIIHK